MSRLMSLCLREGPEPFVGGLVGRRVEYIDKEFETRRSHTSGRVDT